MFMTIFLQIIEKIKDEGAKFIKNSYTDDANSDYYLISKGFNYVQVQVSCASLHCISSHICSNILLTKS